MPIRDKDHLRYVASQPCLVCGRSRAAGLESFGQLEKALNDASERVRANFEDLVKEHGRTPG